MPRKKKHPEPFFRRFDSWWYVQLGKEQIKLAKGEDQEAPPGHGTTRL